MAVQDDARENEMIKLFGLVKPEDESRGGTDAILQLDGVDVPFELKSTTDQDGSVTTVRDFSADHIQKWKGKHWLIGFYNETGKTLKYVLYGAPIAMRPWITLKEQYIAADVALAQHVGRLVDESVMHAIITKKDKYTLEDARNLQKKQLTVKQYKARMDAPGGYTPAEMLKLLKERAIYLVERGSTLNNPHINGTYFSGEDNKGPGTDKGPSSWKTVDVRKGEAHLRELVIAAVAHEAALPAEEAKKADEVFQQMLLDPANREPENGED